MTLLSLVAMPITVNLALSDMTLVMKSENFSVKFKSEKEQLASKIFLLATAVTN